MAFTGKPELTNAAKIANDGFWQDMDMARLMSAYRIPSELDNDVISDRLILAMIEINDQLLTVKEMLLLSYADFDTYLSQNSQEIAGKELLAIKYEEAVFSYAKALLLQQVKTIIRKPQAENAAKEAPETADYWLERSTQAVRFLVKKFLYDPVTETTPQVGMGVTVALI
jgi:hypothetical protein